MDAKQSQQERLIAPFFQRITKDIEQSRSLRQNLRELLQVASPSAPLQEVVNG